MKKKSVVFSVLVLLGFLLVCCTQNVKEKNESPVLSIRTLQEQFKSNLGNSLTMMSDGAKGLMNSVVFSDEAYTSKGVSDDGEDDGFYENLSEDEKQEIERIVKDYIESVKEITAGIKVFDRGVPDGCSETDEEVIIYGINYSKLVPETLEEAFRARDEIYGGGERGVKQWNVCRWNLIGAPKGRIEYYFQNSFSDREKSIIRSCMDEWTDATDGVIVFKEVNMNWWSQLKWYLGITRVVKIYRESRKDYSVSASHGCVAYAYLKINTDKMFVSHSDAVADDYARREDRHALLHELGHIISLQHEFERKDRDNYIALTLGNTSIPGPCGILRWGQKLLLVDYGTYDYKSVMNVADCYCISGSDRLITFDDIENISHNDILTVWRIYDRISEKEMKNRWENTEASMVDE